MEAGCENTFTGNDPVLVGRAQRLDCFCRARLSHKNCPTRLHRSAWAARFAFLAPTAIQGRVQGTLMAMDEKSLVLSAEDQRPLSVPRPAITQLEVSRGKRRRALKGMILGAGIGGALGGAADLLIGEPGNLCFAGCSSSGDSRAGVAGLSVLAGAFYGAGIGALVKSDRRSAVPLEQVRVSLAPTRGRGVRLSLSLAF